MDWTLLADGAADPYHQEAAQRIAGRTREMSLPPPAPGGAFGSLTFSHDPIHNIGGADDTNRNTTQRLLLLLESAPIGDSAAYDRVVKNVLARYVEEDIVSPGDTPNRVPRFLQKTSRGTGARWAWTSPTSGATAARPDGRCAT